MNDHEFILAYMKLLLAPVLSVILVIGIVGHAEAEITESFEFYVGTIKEIR